MAIAEGLRIPFEGPEKIRADLLETFPYEGPRQRIVYETHEFSAVCPFSGLPDIAYVKVEYVPAAKIVELKSLKYYFTSFRSVGIYQEHANVRVYEDLFRVLQAAELTVTMKYNVRGGIDATTSVSTLEQLSR